MSLRDKARQAMQQEAAQAQADKEKARQEHEERKRQEHARLAAQAVAKVREVLGEETSPSDWKVFYEPAGRAYDNDYPERFWVEATLEGATLEYSGGGLQGIYHGIERNRELIPDGSNILRFGAVNSLADFGRLVERVKPPPTRRGWRRR